MLTDEEIGTISCMNLGVYDYARAIERAVLAKAMPIPKQEPVGFVYRDESAKGCKLKASLDILGEEKVKLGDKLYLEPQSAQAAAIPDKIKPATRTLESIGYANGWNDCVDLMLSASTKPE